MSNKSRGDIINSAISTAIAEIATLPICTIKTNYQNTNSTSITQTVKDLHKKGGISAFYRASPASISSQVFSTSSKYFLYRYFERQNFKYSNKFFNGVASGILSSLITHPIDFIRIHMQMGKPIIPEIKTHGPGVFYRGYSKTFGKVFVGSAMFFPLYDYANSMFSNAFIASAFSAVISTTAMQPLDYLKTRHIYGKNMYHGFTIKPYFKGLSLNLARVVPHFIIVMTTIDYLGKKITW